MAGKKQYGRAVLYMFSIAFICTAGVSAVNALMQDGIKINQQLRDTAGIFKAVGQPVPEQQEDLEKLAVDRLRSLADDLEGTFAVQNEKNEIAGYAVRFKGPGFWGPISGYIGISPDFTQIISIVFLSHSETPGLGARITEPEFLLQLKNKTIPPAHTRIKLSQPGKPKSEYDIDAITGATGTSTAVEEIINNSLVKADVLRQILAGRKQP